MDATTGRTVLYKLTENDAARINTERMPANNAAKGNLAHAGEVVPLIVVRAHSNGSVNGQAILDGNDSLWVMSAVEGDETGTWAWPTRV